MSNSPQHESVPDNSPIDDIRWLESTLFTQSIPLITRSRKRSSTDADITWAALPARGTTRRLVPASGRFAAQAFTNHHDAMTSRRRQLGRATRALVRSGALRFGPLLRADANVVFADPDQSVIAAAARELDVAIASCAITLGPHRYNRKPVVQLMDQGARTVGFLKVGADPITSAMVATEAEAIHRLQRPTHRLLDVPTVLWRSEWHGRTVACFSPVASAEQTLVPADESRLVDIASAVVEAGGGHRDVEIRGCAPIQRLRAAATKVHTPEAHHLVDRIEEVFGDRTVSLGPWHGDFSPWNMISTTTSTALIDWEFAGADMPLGADLLHHRVMVATHLHGEQAQRPLQQLLDCGHNIPELHAMAVASDQHRRHLLLYLLELVRRDYELEQAGRPVTGFGDPAAAAAKVIIAQDQGK